MGCRGVYRPFANAAAPNAVGGRSCSARIGDGWGIKMTDAFFVFPNDGFDHEQARAAIEFERAFDQLRGTMQSLIAPLQETWDAIVHFVGMIMREFARVLPRSWCYDTMMRRKIRGAISRGFARRR